MWKGGAYPMRSVSNSLFGEVVISRCLIRGIFNPLSANPTNCSNTLKTIRRQTADEFFEGLAILWGWRLKG